LISLPPEIGELKNLTCLHISHNQLISLPLEIVELEHINVLELGGNPFENLPIEIVNKGREAIINYFKSLEGEQKPLNELKVLLVGEGGAGKLR